MAHVDRHNRGLVDQTYTESGGRAAFLDRPKIHRLSPAASKCESLEWDHEMTSAATVLSINRVGVPPALDMSNQFE